MDCIVNPRDEPPTQLSHLNHVAQLIENRYRWLTTSVCSVGSTHQLDVTLSQPVSGYSTPRFCEYLTQLGVTPVVVNKISHSDPGEVTVQAVPQETVSPDQQISVQVESETEIVSQETDTDRLHAETDSPTSIPVSHDTTISATQNHITVESRVGQTIFENALISSVSVSLTPTRQRVSSCDQVTPVVIVRHQKNPINGRELTSVVGFTSVQVDSTGVEITFPSGSTQLNHATVADVSHVCPEELQKLPSHPTLGQVLNLTSSSLG